MNKTFCFAISSPVASGFVKRGPGLATIFLDKIQLLKIAREDFVRLHAILKTFQVRLQLGRALLRQRVSHPVLIAFDLHHSSLPKIREMLGYLDLGFLEDALEMADAERRARKQMKNAQPRPIAKALIDLNEVHSA
jgi:hypothetical protein